MAGETHPVAGLYILASVPWRHDSLVDGVGLVEVRPVS